MATPPEGPALDRPRDTSIDDQGIAHDKTLTPVPGQTSASMVTGIFSGRVAELPNGTMVGEYEVDGLLGEGGMGRVYSATHPVIGKRAAVKVLHPRYSANEEVVERFVQEARAVNQIGHPNIVDIFAFGTLEDTGLRYFVMEWLKGETLFERMARQRLSRDELCSYVTDISHALEAAHEKKIIHRDLKPENVFLHVVKNKQQIKLLDFGIAKLVSEDTRVERTRTGAMMGTPKYIAPEQARGYAVDHRVDIYSLGVMIFEMVAGRLPFDADNAMDLVAMHLHDEPPLLTDLAPDAPHGLAVIVSAMLSKDAGARPTLARVRDALADVEKLPPGAYTVTDLPIAKPSPTMYAGAPRRSRKLALGLALGVVAAGGIAAAVVLGGGGSKAAEPEHKLELVAHDPPPKLPVKPKDPVPDKPPPKPPAPAPIRERVDIILARLVPGRLLIDSKPEPGTSPWTLAIVPGHHLLVFEPVDGTAVTKDFDVEAGKPLKLELTINKPPRVPPRPPKPPDIKPPKPPKPPGDEDFLPPSKPK